MRHGNICKRDTVSNPDEDDHLPGEAAPIGGCPDIGEMEARGTPVLACDLPDRFGEFPLEINNMEAHPNALMRLVLIHADLFALFWAAREANWERKDLMSPSTKNNAPKYKKKHNTHAEIQTIMMAYCLL